MQDFWPVRATFGHVEIVSDYFVVKSGPPDSLGWCSGPLTVSNIFLLYSGKWWNALVLDGYFFNPMNYFSSHEMKQCCFGDAAVTGGIESLKLYSWTLGFCHISWECTVIQVCLQFGFNSTCFRVLVVDVHIIYLEIWKDLGNKLMISSFGHLGDLSLKWLNLFPWMGHRRCLWKKSWNLQITWRVRGCVASDSDCFQVCGGLVAGKSSKVNLLFRFVIKSGIQTSLTQIVEATCFIRWEFPLVHCPWASGKEYTSTNQTMLTVGFKPRLVDADLVQEPSWNDMTLQVDEWL